MPDQQVAGSASYPAFFVGSSVCGDEDPTKNDHEVMPALS